MKNTKLSMRKVYFLILAGLFFYPLLSNAVTRTWIGVSGGTWSVSTNWSGSATPVSTDDVVFNTSVTVIVDGAKTVNSITINSLASVLFTGNNTTTAITLGGAATSLIDVGSTMTCSGTTVSNRCELTMGSFSSAILNINGTLNLGDLTTYTATCRLTCASGTVVNVNGALNYVGSGSSVAGSAAATFFVNAGGIQETKRTNAGTFPVGTYATTARNIISGITSTTYPQFSSSQATTWGTIEFNAPGNTATGTAGSSLFSSNAICQDFKVINTGSGNCTIATSGSSVRVITTNGNLSVSAGAILNINGTLAGPNSTASGFDIKGNLINDGTITETGSATGSIITMSGTVAQTISSTGSFTQDVSLKINNSSGGVSLLTDLTTSSTSFSLFTFTNGLLSLGNFNLTINNNIPGAIPGGGYSSTSYAKTNGTGALKRAVSPAGNNYIFPVGHDAVALEEVSINFAAPLVATNTLAARFILGTAPSQLGFPLSESGDPVEATSNYGYWQVSAASAMADLYTGTFIAKNILDITSYTKIHLLKRSGAGVAWTFDGTHVTTSGSNSLATLQRTGMSGFSEFGIGGKVAVSLPISVNYISGIKLSGNHLITWKVTCNTTPRATLTLERSAEARSFSGVYTINATALRCAQPFDYTDAQPLTGMNYYRLKMVDVDGKITYSNTIALLNASKGFELLSIAPNPVTNGTFKLNVTSAQQTKMEVVISDIQGRIVSRQTVSMIAGYNSIDVNVTNLAAGTYNISADDKTRVIRFVKQ